MDRGRVVPDTLPDPPAGTRRRARTTGGGSPPSGPAGSSRRVSPLPSCRSPTNPSPPPGPPGARSSHPTRPPPVRSPCPIPGPHPRTADPNRRARPAAPRARARRPPAARPPVTPTRRARRSRSRRSASCSATSARARCTPCRGVQHRPQRRRTDEGRRLRRDLDGVLGDHARRVDQVRRVGHARRQRGRGRHPRAHGPPAPGDEGTPRDDRGHPARDRRGGTVLRGLVHHPRDLGDVGDRGAGGHRPPRR